MSLMGPGAMTEYEAPSRGRRARGTVYVDDPAVGFFVAGSSLKDMNGIYTRKDCAVPGFRVAMSYAHSGKNGWCMALCAEQRERAPKPTTVAKRKPPKIPGGDDSDWETEESEEELSPEEEEEEEEDDAAYLWRLVDPTFRSRFTHKGDTLIPGAGTRWTAVGDAGAVGSGECFGGGDEMRRSDGGGDLWLKVDDGDGDVAWLPAADAAPVPAGDVASAAPPEEPDPEIEAAFDRPFEARLEGDEETTVVEAEAEDDDDAEADAPRQEAPVVAQRARDLNVGDRCVLHSLLGSGFGLEGSVGTVVKARSNDGRYEIAVDGAEGAKRRVVSVKARNGCVVDFAARASERDAAFDARLESDPAGDERTRSSSRERLLEAYGGETGMHATLPAAVLDASPLDLVAGGCCGVRAADAATRAGDSTSQSRARALATLKKATTAGAAAARRAAGARGGAALARCTRSANFKTKGDDAYARGDFGAAVDRYTDAVEAAAAEDPTFRAVCLSNRGASATGRRAAGVDAALALFPTRRGGVAESAAAATDDEILDETKHVDLYTVLGVSADATEAILKRAYRLRSLKYHPDKKGGSTFAFQRVREAFDTLSDPEKRRAYDLGGTSRSPRGATPSESSDEEKPSLREEIERKS
ncbi:hypothetical protein JL722_14581 [Aureococcus anophagefferens]|nr:hypothetical protein JL722_14581 [Aureococcus anophagefferens]